MYSSQQHLLCKYICIHHSRNPCRMYYDRNADLTFTYWDDQISREPLRLDVWDARRSFGETWCVLVTNMAIATS